jgi:hypothetical protein
MVRFLLLALVPSIALAQTPSGPERIAPPPSGVATSNGPGMVTGPAAPMRPVMIPGPGPAGTLIDNGNGTSTIMVPGGPSQVVPTPR